jgi:hypothetical protein
MGCISDFYFREFLPPNLGRKRGSLKRMWKMRMLISKEREIPPKNSDKFQDRESVFRGSRI